MFIYERSEGLPGLNDHLEVPEREGLLPTGRPWTIFEQFWRFLGPFMCILGSSWERLGLFWGHLGPS